MTEKKSVPPKLRPDEERLATLRKAQEEMRPPEGYDPDEAWRRLVGYRESRMLEIDVFFDLVRYAHMSDPWRERRKLKKSLSSLGVAKKHVKGCGKCRPRLESLLDLLRRSIAEWGSGAS